MLWGTRVAGLWIVAGGGRGEQRIGPRGPGQGQPRRQVRETEVQMVCGSHVRGRNVSLGAREGARAQIRVWRAS